MVLSFEFNARRTPGVLIPPVSSRSFKKWPCHAKFGFIPFPFSRSIYCPIIMVCSLNVPGNLSEVEEYELGFGLGFT